MALDFNQQSYTKTTETNTLADIKIIRDMDKELLPMPMERL